MSTTKFSKRGKNPGAVDAWLGTLGYYRKNVAYDETCLFRAIAEQKFCSQLYHERVRKDCIEYGISHSRDFKKWIPKKRDWLERMEKLIVHMLICSEIEIHLICKTYSTNITVFNANDRSINEYKNHQYCKFNKNILLCKMGEDHYDTVYDKEYIVAAGFCQSIIYNLLYENVFNIPNVSGIVNSMLHDKQSSYSIYYTEDIAAKTTNNDHDEDYDDMEDIKNQIIMESRILPNNLFAPFPFKVAKALDPNMYRNIEYDTWLEVRRALRLGDWYYGDDKLILGTRCIVTINDETVPCYIQEILKDNKCIIYVAKFARRLTVNYSDLRPEDNAKPWPLPYRFVKKVPALTLTDDIQPDNEHKSLRKRREKKQSNFNDISIPTNQKEVTNDVNIHNYQGCNLLMNDKSNESSLKSPTSAILHPNSNCPPVNNVENWNQVCNSTGSGSLQLPWSSSVSNANLETPSTTKVITSPTLSYEEINKNEQYYEHEYTYPVPVWIPPHYIVSSDTNVTVNENDCSSGAENIANPPNYVYYSTDNSYGSPSVASPSIDTPPPFTPMNFALNDRFVCNTPVSPVSPHMDVYPFVYPVSTPGIPVFYSTQPSQAIPIPSPLPPPPAPPLSSTLASRPSELITHIGSPLPIYSSPDLPYMPSPTYIYPQQIPSISWYPPNVNAQGFIFPSPYKYN